MSTRHNLNVDQAQYLAWAGEDMPRHVMPLPYNATLCRRAV